MTKEVKNQSEIKKPSKVEKLSNDIQKYEYQLALVKSSLYDKKIEIDNLKAQKASIEGVISTLKAMTEQLKQEENE